VFLLWLFSHLNKRQRKHEQLDELLEEKQEQLALSRLHIEKSERINLEQRAKLSLVNSITPLIDRMLYAIGHLSTTDAQWSMDYIREITDQINADNEVLTQWIQLRQGELSLHIESFALQPLFDIVARGRMGFQMKGITLDVAPTTATVKADRILTLFMLNTLADNARKFTPEGGTVNITATETTDYVEVSVADTGIGMSEVQLEHVFDRTVISDDNAQPSSHGFGLLNCKGIIEKYRKLSHIFTVCTLQAESTEGKGSRFFFRLPKGVVRLLLILFSLHFPLSAIGSQTSSPLHRASIYADSAYFSNINGTYERTLLFADSCRECLNACYQELRPNGNVLMQAVGDLSVVAPEIQWFHDSLNINYNIILDIRNESAVAALALHEWQLYAYNNRIYTMLFKEMSADNTLSEYCRSMQQSQNNKTIAVILLVLVLLAIVPAYYFLYLRHRLAERYQAERLRRDSVDALDDEIRRADMEQAALHVSNAVLDNCLSALKHETMYYPSRIQQLISQPDSQSDGGALAEVTAYYRDLYSLLSQQAMRQTEHTKLHLTTLDDQVLGDDNLIRYLFEILRKQSGGQRLQKTVRPIGDNYVEVTVDMPQLRLTHEQAALLFTPSVANIPYLLCRQIVRDHGEATNRRACSIRAEVSDDGKTLVRIVLPGAMRRA